MWGAIITGACMEKCEVARGWKLEEGFDNSVYFFVVSICKKGINMFIGIT